MAAEMTISHKVWQKLVEMVRHITVEPAMFLVCFAIYMEKATYSEMTIRKSCLNDFNFTEAICENLLDENYTEENDLVQDKVRQRFAFHLFLFNRKAHWCKQ